MATYDYKLAYDRWERELKMAHQTQTDVYAGLTDVTTLDANRQFFKILGQVDLSAMSTEDVNHNHTSYDYEERQIQAAQAYVALKWQKGELDRAHADPIPDAIQAAKMGMNRWNAAVKRTAATGDATAQYEGETSSSTKNLSGDNVIAQGSTSMTEEKVRLCRSVFARNKALQNGERIYLSISQEELDALLQIDHFINADYNGGEAPIKNGLVGHMLGVDFVHDEDLSVSGSNRTCFSWLKKGILFGSQRDVLTRMDEIQDRHYMDQFYLRVDNGATRTRETDVITVNTLVSY